MGFLFVTATGVNIIELMLKTAPNKYRPFPPVHLPDRQWPNRVVTHAPIWCSVDLRDGNQALAVPMNVGQKLELFQTLVKCGFKEIEVGFPSASNTEFTFNRRLIEELERVGHLMDTHNGTKAWRNFVAYSQTGWFA